MSNSLQQMKQLIEQLEKEVKQLPPGVDLAAYIYEKHGDLGKLLAEHITEKRDEATQEADFSPSRVSSLPKPRQTGKDTS